LSSVTTSKVELRPIDANELPQVLSKTRPAYVAERAKADHISLQEASEFAERQLAQILPQGSQTPGHHFVWMIAGDRAERVGFVWYFADAQRREAFIYDLWVEDAHRRRGYASAALSAVADDVRRLGCERLGLNVFATNPAAAALYQKCGFAAVTQHMNKRL
jgi:ribosomal protein S18 acetylase RimI-like enzyme